MRYLKYNIYFLFLNGQEAKMKRGYIQTHCTIQTNLFTLTYYYTYLSILVEAILSTSYSSYLESQSKTTIEWNSVHELYCNGSSYYSHECTFFRGNNNQLKIKISS